jgi:hypothetical protein
MLMMKDNKISLISCAYRSNYIETFKLKSYLRIGK